MVVEPEATWDLGDGVWQRQITPESLRRVAGILKRGGWAVNDAEIADARLWWHAVREYAEAA